jgi:hypothetical protein
VQNFAGLDVEALDRSDPRLEEFKAIQHEIQARQHMQSQQCFVC